MVKVLNAEWRRVFKYISGVYCFLVLVALLNFSSVEVFQQAQEYEDWLANGANPLSYECRINYDEAKAIRPEQYVGMEKLHVEAGGYYKPTDCNPRPQKVAIIVPYRNRPNHLAKFLPYMHNFLQKQRVRYKVFVVEQADENEFSRGMLLNIGAQAALKEEFDCLIFHDVDVLPEHEANLYHCDDGIRHISSAVNEMRYHAMYYNQASCVVGISAQNLKIMNGFSNLYWGWGKEDDDFVSRALASGLRITRPPYHIGRAAMVRHSKGWAVADSASLFMRWQQRVPHDGLNTLHHHDWRLTRTPHGLYSNLSVHLGSYPAQKISDALKQPSMSIFSFLSFFIP